MTPKDIKAGLKSVGTPLAKAALKHIEELESRIKDEADAYDDLLSENRYLTRHMQTLSDEVAQTRDYNWASEVGDAFTDNDY